MQMQAQLAQAKAGLEAQQSNLDFDHKKQLMQLEFQMQRTLKGMEVQGMMNRETKKEDRKDERTRIQASQQSELIEQRKGAKQPKNFESASNSIFSGIN